MSHPRVKVAQLSSEAITVGDLYMLVGAGVHHHVPGIAVQPICPVVVTLGRQSTQHRLDASQASLTPQEEDYRTKPFLPNPATSAMSEPSLSGKCKDPTNLREEMGVGQEELLQKVEQGEGSSQMVA